jgi:hypothetical protein
MPKLGCRHSSLSKHLLEEDHLIVRWLITNISTFWVTDGLPRPFDAPDGQAVEVDGFDFDIEIPSPGTFFYNKRGYPANST